MSTVMNVDIGGGTSKIAVCAEGKVVDLTAVDVGARLVCVDDAGKIVRIEEAGRRFAAELGIKLEMGAPLSPEAAQALASRMADRLFEAMKGGVPSIDGSGLCRLDPLKPGRTITEVTFSGGVSEYIYGREAQSYGDLGVLLAQEIRARIDGWGPTLEPSNEGIRATVIGASQYTTQVSGSTIYVSPMETLPLRNVPVIAPTMALDGEVIDSAEVSAAIKGVLRRLDLGEGDSRSRCSCRGAARRRSSGSTPSARARSTASPTCWRRAIRSCSPATATSAASLGIHLREEMKIDSAHRLDRRARAQGFRLHRHRHHAAGVGRGAGRHQVADLPDLRRHRQGMAAGAARGRRGRGGALER